MQCNPNVYYIVFVKGSWNLKALLPITGTGKQHQKNYFNFNGQNNHFAALCKFPNYLSGSFQDVYFLSPLLRKVANYVDLNISLRTSTAHIFWHFVTLSKLIDDANYLIKKRSCPKFPIKTIYPPEFCSCAKQSDKIVSTYCRYIDSSEG